MAQIGPRLPELQRELASAYDATLGAQEQSRGRLAAALERLAAELARWRSEAAAQSGRAQRAEAGLAEKEAAMLALEKRQDEMVAMSAEGRKEREVLDRKRTELESERAKLLIEVNKAMKSAEEIRREGIEALEQARALKNKPTS